MDWNNPEERRKYYRKYNEANKEKHTEYKHQWYEDNKERIQQQRNSPFGRAKQMVSHFRREDSKRNRGECTITPEWIVENIFTQPCYYCGETDWHKLGCDRIDNSKPHSPDNVVPCCTSCNRKRGTMPFDEFVAKCKEAGEVVTYLNRPDKSKPVFACNPETMEIVYEFPSAAEAGRNGFNNCIVALACNGKYFREGNHKYKGLWWYWV